MTSDTWKKVQRSQRANHCRCGIKRTMEREQLVALTPGCCAPKYICPTLDLALRKNPAPKEEDLDCSS